MKKRIVNILTGGGGSLKGLLSHSVCAENGKSKEVSKLVSKEENKVKKRASARQKLLLTHLPTNLLTQRAAFTMAEILLSLTIIGVVAAITLPSLTGNINERTWNTQRKALYARMSQAISLMPSLNGYGTFVEGSESISAVDTAAETFVTDGLSKVLKINNICDSGHLADCGIPTALTTITGKKLDVFPKKLSELNDGFIGLNSAKNTSDTIYVFDNKQQDTKVAAFETQNGESIAVFYNAACVSGLNESSSFYSHKKMCANFIYDLNGNKGPNTVGKDIGWMTAFYPTDPVLVAPMPLAKTTGASWAEASSACHKQDGDARVPNIEELASVYFNRSLVGNSTLNSGYCHSSVSYSATRAWAIYFGTGMFLTYGKESGGNFLQCIKR